MPTKNAPVEAKVRAATTATFLVSLLVMVLNSMSADSMLLDPLPDWLQAVVIALVPPALAFLAGWQAQHSPRGPAGA
jgi:hypothetical protein